MAKFSCTREIGIDMGHRVCTHGSKCWNLHGHRYTIQATCTAEQLTADGEQTGMVVDFGFLKQLMMDEIDQHCDHGMVMYYLDPWVDRFLAGNEEERRSKRKTANEIVNKHGNSFWPEGRAFGQTKLLLVNFIPTAEALAKFWFECMEKRVREISLGVAELSKVTVYETPNCKAEYPV